MSLVFRTEDAETSVFQHIKRVEGDLTPDSIKLSTSEKYDRDQVAITLENVVILEMDEGYEEPELKDDKFTFYYSYAKPGKKAHKNSLWIKGFVASAEALKIAIPPVETIRVTFEKKAIDCGFKNEDGTPAVYEKLVFAEAVGKEDSKADAEARAKEKMLGKSPQLALRAAYQDSLLKSRPDIIAGMRDGSLAEKLGLDLVDGKYQEREIPF